MAHKHEEHATLQSSNIVLSEFGAYEVGATTCTACVHVSSLHVHVSWGMHVLDALLWLLGLPRDFN